MILTYCRAITGHPRLVLLALLVVTGLSIHCLIDFGALAERRLDEIVQLEVDPSLDSLIPAKEPSRLFYDQMRDTLGIGEALVLVVHRDEGIFERRFLASLLRTSDRLESHESVSSILALPSAPNIRDNEGSINVGAFYDEEPTTKAEIRRIRSQFFENPAYAGALVSDDERSTAIVVYLFDVPASEFARKGIDREIWDIAREEFGETAEISLTGGPLIKAETTRTMMRDLVVVVPAVLLICSLVAFFFFRTLRGVMIPLLTIVFGLIWTLGLIAVTDARINVVTVSIPALILVIGFCYAIHVISSYYEAINTGRPPGDVSSSAALRGMQRIALPTLLTSVTTAAGFFSLAVSRLDALRLFGIHCGFGVLCTMVATLTLAPALLQLLPEKSDRVDTDRMRQDRRDRFFRWLGESVLRRRSAVLWGAAVVALFSLASLTQVVVSTNLADNFGDDSDVKRGINAARRHLGSVDQIYVVLEATAPDAFVQPSNLELIERIQAEINMDVEVDGTTSLADYVKQLNRAFNENDPRAHRIPESAALISQLLLVSSSEELDRMTDSQRQYASMAVRIKTMDSERVRALAERLEAIVENASPSLKGHVTGNPVLLARTNDDIAYGQAASLCMALLIIYAILSLLFMSLRVGFLALISNVLPVLVYFAALAVTGVTLNILTGSVACIVLGVAVDDTIHFLTRFNQIAKQESDERSAAVRTLMEVGRPVSVTTVGLCLGFSILGLAELKSLADFGLLSAFTLGAAWLVDVTLTPALAAGMRIVTLSDVVARDLGTDPVRAIPLFRGLEARQSRLALRMFKKQEFPAGHRLIREGAEEDSLYVVLQGRLRSSLRRNGRQIEIHVHEQGDSVGGIGALRGRRTADVYCDTDTRLLWLDGPALESLGKRHPRIGATLYRNLAAHLAERLAGATARTAG